VLTARRRVIPGQAGELVEQPPRGKRPDQALDLPGAGQAGRDHQVEPLGGQRDEGQAVGEGRGLAGDARVGQPGADGRRHLKVPGDLGAVAGQPAAVDAQAGQLAVEHAAGLGARLPVHQAQPAAGHVA
jgi:hypothetical protein